MSQNQFCRFDLLVIGGSAGSTKVITEIISELPAHFPAAILTLQHFGSEHLGYLLHRRSELPVKILEFPQTLVRGNVYVCPTELQTTIASPLFVQMSPLGFKKWPTLDPLLKSAARNHGARIIGVVLSGLGTDGAEGVRAVKKQAGRVLAQTRRSALHPGMPDAAISTGCVDHALPPRTIAKALTSLVMVRGAAELFEVGLPSWVA